jgi:prolyl-tRNA synthetase
VITRMSALFLRTLREDPADAEVPSHRLLVRAGYIRRVTAGIYSWLPLGKMVLENVARVVREEMDRIGGQEVLFPALLPRDVYEASGRWEAYGSDLFRLKDRKGSEYLLGPTHEELFTLLVKDLYSSYRDFPLILYQVQTKYRDEPRPRSGVIRGREFVMKDAYSFDLDDEGLQASYDLHRGAYQRIFTRLGLDFRIVAADSGLMGGSASEEFLAPAAVGEDTFVQCASCDYAANVEAVVAAVPPPDGTAHPPMEVLDTPGTPTIETLAAYLGIPASTTLKNLLVKVGGEIVGIGVPGDRDVHLVKLEAALAPAKVEPLEQADFDVRPELVKGYVGPQDRAGTVRPFRFYADPRVAANTAWVTGANAAGHHARHVVAGRDFTVDRYLDVATMLPGDPCPRCGSPMSIDRGIEIGHIFQLGRRFTDTFSLDVLGSVGQPIRVTMGSYGVGVSRAVAAIAEQTADAAGLCWPAEIAPYDVHLLAVGKAGQLAAAERLAEELSAAGLRVLLDDRTASAGVKFADADLVGIPIIVVLGKALIDGEVEIKSRRSGERRRVALAAVLAELSSARLTGGTAR